MISLGRFSIYSIIPILAWFCSCNSTQIIAQDMNTQISNNEGVSFVEMRRLNKEIELPEVSHLNDFTAILNLYKKLENSNYSKSFPIPGLDEGETLIILKPKLTIEKYGDLEITNIQKRGDALSIEYKEIKNQEYEIEKASNPILIIKISEKFKTIIINKKT